MTKKRIVQIVLLLLAAISFLFCYMIYRDAGRIDTVSWSEYVQRSELEWSVEEFDVQSEMVVVKGWLYEPGVSGGQYHTTVALKEPGTDICICLPTQGVKSKELTKKAKDGVNYDSFGFLARGQRKYLSVEKKQYELVLLFERGGEKYGINTGIILDKGVPVNEK